MLDSTAGRQRTYCDHNKNSYNSTKTEEGCLDYQLHTAEYRFGWYMRKRSQSSQCSDHLSRWWCWRWCWRRLKRIAGSVSHRKSHRPRRVMASSNLMKGMMAQRRTMKDGKKDPHLKGSHSAQRSYLGVVALHLRKAWVRDLSVAFEGMSMMIVHTVAKLVAHNVGDLTVVGGTSAATVFSPFTTHARPARTRNSYSSMLTFMR